MARINLNDADSEFKKIVDYYKDELSKLRSGRANPDLVAGIKVNAYGQSMPLNQLANINVADPTLLVVQPWDKTLVNEIRTSISSANIGINPLVDGDLIRLPLPALTEERRQEYVKLLKSKEEEARVRVRQVRKDVLVGLEEDKKATVLSEDDFDRKEKELQLKVDDINKEIEQIAISKEKDLMTV